MKNDRFLGKTGGNTPMGGKSLDSTFEGMLHSHFELKDFEYDDGRGMLMIRYPFAVVFVLCLMSFQLPAADKPAADKGAADAKAAEPVSDDAPKKLDPAHLKALTEALEAKPGEIKGRVFTLTLPRADLDVNTIEMGDIPVEAGLATTIRMFRCGCGKYYVIGEFCVADYESNDVIDALRAGQFQIASVAPMLLQEKPRIVLIRFQGDNDIDGVIKTLKEAVRWVGENRTKRNPIK
jgi:hypothetical protein